MIAIPSGTGGGDARPFHRYEPPLTVEWAFCHPTFYPVFLPSPFQVFLEAERVVSVAEPGVVFVGIVFVVAPEVDEPQVVFVVALEVAEPGVVFVAIVFVALVSVADVAEPQASVDIALAFDVLVPVSVVAVEVDSSGRPRFLAFPNVDYYASSSSSVEVVG